jgi:hypothetical protein
MPISVQIVDEQGAVEAVFIETGLDPRLVSRAPANSCVLRFVDPYGDLVLNQLQLQALDTELEEVLDVSAEDDLRRHIADLRAFLAGAQSAHMYVRFVGD